MIDLIDVRFSIIDSDEIRDEIKTIISPIIDEAKSIKIWDESIKSIVITDNINDDVQRQADKWERKFSISKEKEYEVIGKVLFNHDLDHPEHIIFVSLNLFFSKHLSIKEALFSQILSVHAKSIIPIDVLKIQFTFQPQTLDTFSTILAIEGCKVNYSKNRLKEILRNDTTFLINHNLFLTAFKRSLRRCLFEYNSDKYTETKRLDTLWRNICGALQNIVLGVVENDTDNKSFHIIEQEQCRELLYAISDEIKIITKVVVDSKEFNITTLKQKIIDFASFFEVHLQDGPECNFSIRLTKNPKDYFYKELVDTEPRIICFLDILGFRDFVRVYEADSSSTFLQDIQESFKLTQDHLLNKSAITQNIDTELIKHIEYQTFSDNVCISIPYFDNERDFLSNFNILITFARGFQLIMMSKGFFIRGGVSIGSYYADDNIIFSKGLINAYDLERLKAIYPRIVIDKLIMNKFWDYDPETIESFGLYQAIIFDWEDQAFLNPIRLMESSLQQINAINLDDDDSGEDSILSSLTNMVKDLTINTFKTVAAGEEETINEIKRHLQNYLDIYRENEHIYAKYLWFKELINWIENEESERLKFYYLKDKMEWSE
ncbi:MAG: hypothetical protein HQ565_07865 [Bacteroidetes bacterium]|nr:hypothetical protein [Bacteroidota bacterium]